MRSARIILPNTAVRLEPWPWGALGQPGTTEKPRAGQVSVFEPSTEQRESTIVVLNEDPDQQGPEDPGQKTFEAGFIEGKVAAEQGLRNRFNDLGKAIASIDEAFKRMRREAETDQVAIALAVARRILHREVQIDQDALKGLVSSAMAKIQAHKTFRVVVEPSLRVGLVRALGNLSGGDEIEVDSDPALSAGTILFHTSRGTLDASFDAQLQEIENGLIDRLERM